LSPPPPTQIPGYACDGSSSVSLCKRAHTYHTVRRVLPVLETRVHTYKSIALDATQSSLHLIGRRQLYTTVCVYEWIGLTYLMMWLPLGSVVKTGCNGLMERSKTAVFSRTHLERSVAVAKKADRTEYDVRYSCRTEPPKMPPLK